MFHKEEAVVSTDLSVMPTRKSNYAYACLPKKKTAAYLHGIFFSMQEKILPDIFTFWTFFLICKTLLAQDNKHLIRLINMYLRRQIKCRK